MRAKTRMYIRHNRSLKPVLRWYFNAIKNNQEKNSCLISGRHRGFFRFARLSRLFLRDPLYIGALPGLKKSAW